MDHCSIDCLHHIVFNHLLTDFGFFPVWGCHLEWIQTFSSRLSRNVFASFWSKYAGVDGQILRQACAHCLSKWTHWFPKPLCYFPSQHWCMKFLVRFSHILVNLFYFKQSQRYVVASHWDFNVHWLGDWYTEHLFSLIYPLMKCLLKSF